jgi:hypothetical protein
VAEALRARGVGVRVFSGLPGEVPALAASGGVGFRLNAGPDAVQQAFLDALGAVLGAGGAA